MEKTKKQAEEQFVLLDENEVAEREQSYIHRLMEVQSSENYIAEAKIEYTNEQKEKVVRDSWLRYLRCDGLPKPHNPQEIRTFIAKLQHFEDISKENTADWTLAINEESILTQSIFRIDQTRKTLQATRPNFGDEYNQRVELYLATLRNIDVLLRNEVEMCKIDLRRAKEIVSLREAIEIEINELFNNFCYRIISSDLTYMDTRDGTQINYSYQGQHFRMHIWALRDVPIRFNQLDVPIMNAELTGCNTSVQIPLSVLSDNLTLCCVHSYFDHYSAQAKSYEQIITKDTKDLMIGMSDMEDCLTNEWLMQVDLREEMCEQLRNKYKKYQEASAAIAEKQEQLAKLKKKEGKDKKKSIKLLKLPKEPLFVPENMYPDTYNLFLKREEEQYKQFLNEVFDPNILKLEPDEINLRKYHMLGGIYTFNFVRKPKYTNFECFNITSHEKYRKLYAFKGLVADIHFLEGIKTSLSMQGSKGELRAETVVAGAAAGAKAMATTASVLDLKELNTDEHELLYFFVTFTLPQNICLWGNPIVCHFEDNEIEMPEEITIVPEDLVPQIIRQIKLNEIVNNLRKWKHDVDSQLTKIERRTHNSLNVYRTPLHSLLRQSKLISDAMTAAVPVANFHLQEDALSKEQIRTLQRYAVPRILESFQFDRDFLDEEAEELEKKATKSSPLMKTKNETHELELARVILPSYSFEVQTKPERVFPVFPSVESIYWNSDDSVAEHNNNDKPETLCDLLKTLDNIKEKYLTNSSKILNQQEFNLKQTKARFSESPELASKKLEARKSSLALKTQSKSLMNFKMPLIKAVSQFNVKSKSAATIDAVDADATSVKTKGSQSSEESAKKPAKTMITIKHWTTKYIYSSVFDKANNTIKIQTDRLGIFGFAFDRYIHFPFQYWSFELNPDNDDEFLLTIDTKYVTLKVFVSSKGFSGYVTKYSKEYVSKPVKYVNIEQPIASFDDFKEILRNNNVNIFAEYDASFYISGGYFSEKHLACEFHTYNIIALHCRLFKFYYSFWNRLATRRNIILCLKDYAVKDPIDVTVRITPENATFVEITELCADNLDEFNLKYTTTWRNIGSYTDLHYAILSLFPSALDRRIKEPSLLHNIRTVFCGIRPLSYS